MIQNSLGVIDLTDTAVPLNDFSSGFMMIIALGLAFSQWYMVKQTQPQRVSERFEKSLRMPLTAKNQIKQSLMLRLIQI